MVLDHLGVRSAFRLAANIGYGDPRSLYRLSRTLLDRPWSEFLSEDAQTLLIDQLGRWAAEEPA